MLVLAAAALQTVHADNSGTFNKAFADYRAQVGDGIAFYASCITHFRITSDDTVDDGVYLFIPRSEKVDILMIETRSGDVVDMTTIERETPNKHFDTVIDMSALEANNGGFRITDTLGGIGSIMRVSGMMDQLLMRPFHIATAKDLDRLPITGPPCDDDYYHYNH